MKQYNTYLILGVESVRNFQEGKLEAVSRYNLSAHTFNTKGEEEAFRRGVYAVGEEVGYKYYAVIPEEVYNTIKNL